MNKYGWDNQSKFCAFVQVFTVSNARCGCLYYDNLKVWIKDGKQILNVLLYV